MHDPATERVRLLVDELYKSHYGKLVATLFSHYRDLPLETIEDIVQDSFAAALTAWTSEALPANPGGWVFTVCRNKAINRIKEEKNRWSRLDQQDDVTGEEMNPAAADLPVKLLFACAHPDLQAFCRRFGRQRGSLRRGAAARQGNAGSSHGRYRYIGIIFPDVI